MARYKEANVEEVGKLVSQQAKSGQSVAASCRERGLCAPHLFAWKKRPAQATAQKFVEVRVEAPAATVSRVVTDPAIEIRLENHRGVMVRPGFDAQHLQAVLAVLEQRS